MEDETSALRLELIPLSKSAKLSVSAHQNGGQSMQLAQDRDTARFVLGSARQCHLTFREAETENEVDWIHIHHAIIYPDPDSAYLELFNPTPSTVFRLWLMHKSESVQEVRPGQQLRLISGTWHVEFTKTLVFEVRIPAYEMQHTALCESLPAILRPSIRETTTTKPASGFSTPPPSPLNPSTGATKGAAIKGRGQGKKPAALAVPLTPRTSGKAVIAPRKTIGETARTVVFKGERDGIVTAVKIARKPTTRVTAEEWRNEYGLLRQLHHQNISHLIYYDARALRLEFEFVGADLSTRVHANRMSALTPGEQYTVLRDISHGVAYIHREGVSHCDIKPQNILLSDDKQRAVLCDFGQSVWGDIDTRGGTPRYLPPEYATSSQRGFPADVWAFGITMLFAIGLLALPSQSGWPICEISEDERVKEQMAEWIRSIKAIEVPERWAVVTEMLEVSRRKRIAVEAVVEAVENMAQMQLHV